MKDNARAPTAHPSLSLSQADLPHRSDIYEYKQVPVTSKSHFL